MASLDTLPPDQRAVLDLVLQRGRSYDEIARLLGIDRAAVRARALAAFDALGPDTGIAPESRALITDYLLGQLPEPVADQTRDRLASSPYERAWARVLASELGQVAAEPLPEIPDGARAAASSPAATPAESGPAGGDGAGTGTPPGRPRGRERDRDRQREGDRGERRTPRLSDRPSSRRGGAILLGVGALIVIAVVVLLIVVLSGGPRRHSAPSSPAATGTATTNTTGTSGAGTATSATTPKAQVVAQSNLNPPNGGGQARGVGIVVKEGGAYGIVIEAAHLAPNNKNAYAAWLYNSPSDSLRLGFVSPPVGKSGTFQVGQALPSNASHFKQLLVTLETQSNPKAPGTIVLQGPFSLSASTSSR